ncbi:MAG: putative ABC transporter ATP-binding protein [Candidatus Carbobacillus altaicus]|uniref:Putative ABC transporter ATP-binding protein n=1 Tax=Candidatus Carbonibacillus altaicus TaxID=2163959 RepID=A0A2R6Y3L4_9BACL|nr:MAG: putative ABC transporter ATP-binding protein [Candidatus Carbobacillus altaicus]
MLNVKPIIQVEGLQKIYESAGGVFHQALRGVQLDVMEGTFTAIMGPSGSGKTTLLNLLAGLDRPSAGSITIAGERIDQMPEGMMSMFRRRAVGFVFQDYNLLDPLTVYENIVLPIAIDRRVTRKDSEWIMDLLKRVGLGEKKDRFPYELSGGEQQRVAILRAIASNAQIILADEPTGNLDSASSRVVLETFSMLQKTYGKTIVMVTHDPFAASFAERLFFLKDGARFAELHRGSLTREAFYQRILETLSTLEMSVHVQSHLEG